MNDFDALKRQRYIDSESYRNTVEYLENGREFYGESLGKPEEKAGEHADARASLALDLWRKFQIDYTADKNMPELAAALEEIVETYDAYVKKNEEKSDDEYYPPFVLDDMIDTYVDFINLLSAAILLHREDLLGKIFGWIDGGEYDGIDAVLEELLNFYFPDRPSPDTWIWKQPYQKLLDVIDSPTPTERSKLMAKYIRSWYPAMKGQASFWGKHEKIKPELSPYFGYWAMCAAAFTYLLDIDDTLYRNEEVYPKDMVDYARSLPRRPVKFADGTEILRVEGGQPCSREGNWFSPAKNDSTRYFKAGEMMPAFDASEYGRTIWQWMPGI